MPLTRSSGLLLHPSSLPGPTGIGAIGPNAYRFVDVLVAAGMSLWQMLPLVPTGYGDSPYAGTSAFAGNPMLIDAELLVQEGLLNPRDVDSGMGSTLRVDFGRVVPAKLGLLRCAFARFLAKPGREQYDEFCVANASWLDDFALFMALKEAHGGIPWSEWEPDLRSRDPGALREASERYRDDVEFHRFTQFLFTRQWQELRTYAHSHGVSIVGDLPIFVAHDSSDVWSHQDEFLLDADGLPTVVAGVPPITSAKQVSAGGTRTIAGKRCAPQDSSGGSKGFASCWTLSTLSAWTIFVAS